MDLPEDKETLTLIKSEINESGEYFDTDTQDASKDICVPLSSFDHTSLQMTKIKEEVNADDCSIMIRIEKEAEPDYIHTVHTAYRDEPRMDDQPDNTLSFINKCIKSESSDHIVHHHTNMDVTIYAQQHIEKASVVIDSEFSKSTTVKCHINIDTIKTEVSESSTQSCPKLMYESDNLGHIDVFSTANVNPTKLSSTNVNTHVFPECGQRYGQIAEEMNPCSNKCAQTSTLDQHNCPEQQHACPACGKRLALASNLKRHMLIHTGEKQHTCPECGKRFTLACNLKRHMLIHTVEEQHACPECGKRFTQAGYLTRHLLIHTGEKQYACPSCDKKFTQAGNLKKHMLIHAGEKQHACLDCDKKFTQAGDLKKHMLIHTGEKQHACPECGKRFARAGDIKRHLLTHT